MRTRRRARLVVLVCALVAALAVCVAPQTSRTQDRTILGKVECADPTSFLAFLTREGPTFYGWLNVEWTHTKYAPLTIVHERAHLARIRAHNFRSCEQYQTWLETGDNLLNEEVHAFCAEIPIGVAAGVYADPKTALETHAKTLAYQYNFGITHKDAEALLLKACPIPL